MKAVSFEPANPIPISNPLLPESGSRTEVGSEPARPWICPEQAYGDRLRLGRAST